MALWVLLDLFSVLTIDFFCSRVTKVGQHKGEMAATSPTPQPAQGDSNSKSLSFTGNEKMNQRVFCSSPYLSEL